MPAAEETRHILLIEDSAVYARLIKGLFADAPGGGYTVSRVATLESGIEALRNGRVDLVLLDLTLPDGEGIDSFRRVRSATPDAPIIVLTGLDSDEIARTAVREGAQDYLLKKEISRGAVLRCVNYAIDRKKAERELTQARKMESIGQLAAGIAHEINTPIQYVGDSVSFLQEAFEDLASLRSQCLALCDAIEKGEGGDPAALVSAIRSKGEEIDLAYLDEEAPKAFERASEGVQRVAEVVRAMREFSHPARKQKEHADLNRSILNALTVARSQYRYVADAETDLDDIPKIPCHVGEINQVLLNLIVNAAHAIEDNVAQSDRRGKISVRSKVEGDAVRIEVEDTGCGMPEDVRARVFDPFFTTKEVGRGTGQGLSLAHTCIVIHHGGVLDFETEPGAGTTFWFTLPIEPDDPNKPGSDQSVLTQAVEESPA